MKIFFVTQNLKDFPTNKSVRVLIVSDAGTSSVSEALTIKSCMPKKGEQKTATKRQTEA